MSNEEGKYIAQQEADRRRDARRDHMVAALRQQERTSIAGELHTSEAIAEEALQLGFDKETARILHFIPLIQVAWADGKIQGGERDVVERLAKAQYIEEGTPAWDFLMLLLERRPSDVFFERVNIVISHLIKENPDDTRNRKVLDFCVEVAEAAGGFFGTGLGDTVSKEERELIEDLQKIFQS